MRGIRSTSFSLMLILCTTLAVVGCSRSQDAELARAKAEADAARSELARVKAEADAVKAKADAEAAEKPQPARISSHPPKSKVNRGTATKSPTIAELQQILLAYNSDYNQADKKYKGKLLQISGVVGAAPAESESDICGSLSTYIVLGNGAIKSKYSVVIYFSDGQQRVEVRKLSKGQRVTVQGRFDGLARPTFFGRDEDATLITMGVGGGECKLIPGPFSSAPSAQDIPLNRKAMLKKFPFGGVVYTFSQSTGKFKLGKQVLGKGSSGQGDLTNKPEAQNKKAGPISQGRWKMNKRVVNNKHIGPSDYIQLSAVEKAKTFGRFPGFFFIVPDDASNLGGAQTTIRVPRKVWDAIVEHGGSVIDVIP